MKASLEPLSTQFEKLLTVDPELTAAEERMRNSEEMLRAAQTRLSETLEEARARTQRESHFFQALGAQMGQQIATYKVVATTRDIAVTSPQTFVYRPDSTAPAAGAFPSTAEEFAKYAANRRL
jgi:hypothetical protein